MHRKSRPERMRDQLKRHESDDFGTRSRRATSSGRGRGKLQRARSSSRAVNLPPPRPPTLKVHEGKVLTLDEEELDITNWRLQWQRRAVMMVAAGLLFYFGVLSVLLGLAFYMIGQVMYVLMWLLLFLGGALFLPRIFGIIMTKGLVPVVHGFPLDFKFLHVEPWLTWGELHIRVKVEGLGFGNPPNFPHYYFLKVHEVELQVSVKFADIVRCFTGSHPVIGDGEGDDHDAEVDGDGAATQGSAKGNANGAAADAHADANGGKGKDGESKGGDGDAHDDEEEDDEDDSDDGAAEHMGQHLGRRGKHGGSGKGCCGGRCCIRRVPKVKLTGIRRHVAEFVDRWGTRAAAWAKRTVIPAPWPCPLIKSPNYKCFCIIAVNHVSLDGVSINFEMHRGELNINGFTRILSEGETTAALNAHMKKYGAARFTNSPSPPPAAVATAGAAGAAGGGSASLPPGHLRRVPKPKNMGAPMPNQLRVYVKRCRNLKAADHNLVGEDSSDPFVVIEARSERHVTSTVYHSLDPIVDEECFLHCEDPSTVLHIKVMDEDVTSNEMIGQWIMTTKWMVMDPTYCYYNDLDVHRMEDGSWLMRGWFPLFSKKWRGLNSHGEIEMELQWRYVPGYSELWVPPALSALAQIKVNSAETNLRLGDPMGIKRCLKDLPLLLDIKRVSIHHVNLYIEDLFSGMKGHAERVMERQGLDSALHRGPEELYPANWHARMLRGDKADVKAGEKIDFHTQFYSKPIYIKVLDFTKAFKPTRTKSKKKVKQITGMRGMGLRMKDRLNRAGKAAKDRLYKDVLEAKGTSAPFLESDSIDGVDSDAGSAGGASGGAGGGGDNIAAVVDPGITIWSFLFRFFVDAVGPEVLGKHGGAIGSANAAIFRGAWNAAGDIFHRGGGSKGQHGAGADGRHHGHGKHHGNMFSAMGHGLAREAHIIGRQTRDAVLRMKAGKGGGLGGGGDTYGSEDGEFGGRGAHTDSKFITGDDEDYFLPTRLSGAIEKTSTGPRHKRVSVSSLPHAMSAPLRDEYDQVTSPKSSGGGGGGGGGHDSIKHSASTPLSLSRGSSSGGASEEGDDSDDPSVAGSDASTPPSIGSGHKGAFRLSGAKGFKRVVHRRQWKRVYFELRGNTIFYYAENKTEAKKHAAESSDAAESAGGAGGSGRVSPSALSTPRNSGRKRVTDTRKLCLGSVREVHIVHRPPESRGKAKEPELVLQRPNGRSTYLRLPTKHRGRADATLEQWRVAVEAIMTGHVRGNGSSGRALQGGTNEPGGAAGDAGKGPLKPATAGVTVAIDDSAN
eukprot:g2625.t1